MYMCVYMCVYIYIYIYIHVQIINNTTSNLRSFGARGSKVPESRPTSARRVPVGSSESRAAGPALPDSHPRRLHMVI